MSEILKLSIYQRLLNFWNYQIRPVLFKECIHILNDSATWRIAVIIPLFQLLIFGYAINNEVRDIKTYIFDQDQSHYSNNFIDKLKASTYIKIEKFVYSKEEINLALIKGKAQLGLIIPPDFSRKLLAKQKADIQIIIDGSDSTVANQIQGAIQQLSFAVSEELNKYSKAKSSSIQVKPVYLFNPNLETPFFVLPALLGIIVFLVTTFLCCLSIVKEKERGTLEQLLVTPLSPLGLMIGKIIPYIGIGLFDFNLSLYLIFVLFGIDVKGSLLLLELATFVFMFSALGLSLIISTISSNQAQAAQLTQMALLPSIFLSGYVFPFDSMPTVFQVIGYILPVTHFVRISRGIILRGADFGDLVFNFGVLTLEAIIILAISIKLLKKQLV